MQLDTPRLILIWFALILAMGLGVFGYRQHLNVGAHWITKALCEDRPVFTGKYKECIAHYAPAEGS